MIDYDDDPPSVSVAGNRSGRACPSSIRARSTGLGGSHARLNGVASAVCTICAGRARGALSRSPHGRLGTPARLGRAAMASVRFRPCCPGSAIMPKLGAVRGPARRPAPITTGFPCDEASGHLLPDQRDLAPRIDWLDAALAASGGSKNPLVEQSAAAASVLHLTRDAVARRPSLGQAA